jgi:transcriptional regulator with XRE-family HTH domain
MRLGDLRRQNLLLILEHAFDRKPTLLAKRMGKSGAQISQWKSGHRDIHEDSARRIELAAGKPVGWMDLPHDSGHEGLVTRETVAALPFHSPRPAPRVALEALCDELARVAEPERREALGTLLRACALAGGDASYVEPILSLLRVRSPPANGGNVRAA